MKLFKLDIYRGSELIYSNVYNDTFSAICDRIASFRKDLQKPLFITVRQMYFNSFGELKPKMYKGKFNYSLSCTIDSNTTDKEIIDFICRNDYNLIENKVFAND